MKTETGLCSQCEHEEEVLLYDGVCSHCYELQRKWDLENGAATITEENIHLYYEFMSIENLIENKVIISKALNDRFGAICSGLDLPVSQLQSNITFECAGTRVVVQEVFKVKDTLKTINEYIAVIKESNEYKEYRKSIFSNNGKSKECTNVLQLMGLGYDYTKALKETLFVFDNVSKDDLELELEIYI